LFAKNSHKAALKIEQKVINGERIIYLLQTNLSIAKQNQNSYQELLVFVIASARITKLTDMHVEFGDRLSIMLEEKPIACKRHPKL